MSKSRDRRRHRGRSHRTSIDGPVNDYGAQAHAERAARAGHGTQYVVVAVAAVTLAAAGCGGEPGYTEAYRDPHRRVEVTPTGDQMKITVKDRAGFWGLFSGREQEFWFDVAGRPETPGDINCTNLTLRRYHNDPGFWDLEKQYHDPVNIVHDATLKAQQVKARALWQDHLRHMTVKYAAR